MIKKTTTVTTETTVGGKTVKTVRTTETETVASTDGDAGDGADIDQAMKESSDALGHFFDGFNERMDAVFRPFDRIFKRKTATKKDAE